MSSAPNPPDSSPPDSTVVVESQIPLHGLGPLDPNSSEAAKTVTASGDKTTERPAATLQATAPPNYEVLSEIGRGGMGVVYKARQRALNRIVALKVVLAGGHASLSQRVRFLAEAEAVAALNHPGIVSVYEFGTWGEQPYMALEYCPGGTLADKLRGTPIPARDASSLVERVARAVAAVHDRGIIHRDLKPANILFGTDGSPKVGDFGLAKMSQSAGLTVTGAVLGTPSYMAPEQARGQAKSVGPAADIYALGAVLYECFTGRPPFRGASPSDTIVQSLSQEPVAVRALNPSVPVDLETVCLKCLEKDPARRYPSAVAFANDLQRFLDGRPVLARPVGPLGRLRRWVARNQLVSALLAAVVVTLVAGTTTTYVKYLGEAKERATAVQAVGEKQKALTELEKTLQDLEKLTKEQADTLGQLRREKAATEDALLRGLLRPLRNQPNTNILHEEARALFELSALPEERLKFRFIENGLDSQDGFEKITAWPQEVVAAVVGLDRATALRLRGHLAEILKSPVTSPRARTACAVLVGLLPLDDVEVNRLAVRVLAERLTQGASTAPSELMISFVNLTRRLPESDVANLARMIAERMRLESDPHGLDQLSSALTALSPRLEPRNAAKIASLLTSRLIAEPKPELLSPLSSALTAVAGLLETSDAEDSARTIERSLTDRLPSEKDSSAILKCSVGLTALTTRVAPEVERALLSPAVRALATRCQTEKESNPIENLTSGLVVLASRASPVDRSLAAKVLAERANSEKDALVVSKFAAALNRLAAHLPTDELAQLVKPLFERLGTETDPSTRNYLAAALGEISRCLPAAESASLLHRPVLLSPTE
ncbi:MAG: protein kinase [Gemmataceae bacterium]